MLTVITPTITPGPINITPTPLRVKIKKIVNRVKVYIVERFRVVTNITSSYVRVAPIMRIGALFEMGGMGLVCSKA